MEVPRIPFKVQCEGAEELYIAVPEEEVGGVELAALVIHHPTRGREGERERGRMGEWVRESDGYGGKEGEWVREGEGGGKERQRRGGDTYIILTYKQYTHTP
jgi:hypothetical protein